VADLIIRGGGGFNNQRWWRIPLTGLTPHPERNWICNIFYYYYFKYIQLFKWLEVWGGCSFWYWWNCWPSLFKLSFNKWNMFFFLVMFFTKGLLLNCICHNHYQCLSRLIYKKKSSINSITFHRNRKMLLTLELTNYGIFIIRAHTLHIIFYDHYLNDNQDFSHFFCFPL
jgi:hypothetical protein